MMGPIQMVGNLGFFHECVILFALHMTDDVGTPEE